MFNAEKIQFKVTTVTYMGNVVTKDGMRPDPDNIEAIVNMPKNILITQSHDIFHEHFNYTVT